MATLQAKKITAALTKAVGVGRVEDNATIAGCHVVLRSLRPEEYELIHADTAEKEDLSYLNAYRIEHLARSIVELNGENLRQVETVEVEEEGEDGALTVVAVEKHAFLRDHVLSTWSREAVDVAFRKFNELITKSDKVAAEGVRFDTPDETSEDKYRRLLTELREVETELPMDLALKLLEDNGYTKRVSTQDFEAAQERLRNMVTANESKTAEQPPAPEPSEMVREPDPEPEPLPPPQSRPQTIRATPPPPAMPPPSIRQAPAQAQQVVPATTTRAASPEDLMRLRQPVHGHAQPPIVARAPSGAPPGLTRSQQIAMEEGVDPIGEPALGITGGTEIPEVQPRVGVDPKAAAAILDRPPTGGVNKRFRPPPT